MKNKSTYVVALAVAMGICVVAAPVANAQVSASGPFVGTLQESFEKFTDFVHTSPIFSFEPSPVSVFGGAASLTGNSFFVFNPTAGSNFRLWTSGNDATPNAGVQGMGVANLSTDSTFTFATPIYSFGGYFGARTGVNPGNNSQSTADPAAMTMKFFDNTNTQIGATQTWNYSRTGFADGLLEWHGFISTVGATKVVVGSPALYAYDNLQAASVPEPGIMASLIGAGTIGGLMVIRRRRKA